MSGTSSPQTVTESGTSAEKPPSAVTWREPVYVPASGPAGTKTSTKTGWLVSPGTLKGWAASAPEYGSTRGTSGSGTLPSPVGELAGAGTLPLIAETSVKSRKYSR